MKKFISWYFFIQIFLNSGFIKAQTFVGPVTIDPSIFGQNAWYIDVSDNNASTFSSLLDGKIAEIARSGVRFVRIGGLAVNYEPLYSWNAGFTINNPSQVDRLTHLINIIRSNKMEPIVQVGYDPTFPAICTTAQGPLAGLPISDQATIAGNLVKYLNDPITGLYKPNPIKYWSICNEPDYAIDCSTTTGPGGFKWNGAGGNVTVHAGYIASYVKAFSLAMKTADPEIKIIAPDLSGFGNDVGYSVNKLYNNELISNGSNSIMGQISCSCPANMKYYVDVISFHHYPKIADIPDRAAVIAEPGGAVFDGFKEDLVATLLGRKGIVDMILSNTGRNVSNLKVACTEFNILNPNAADEVTNYALVVDPPSIIDSRSFIAGQWMADTYSQAMNTQSGGEPWIKFMNVWSAIEGDPACSEGLGYISACSTSVVPNRKRSEYWHHWLLARNFVGKFYMGNTTLPNLKVFSSRNCNQIALMLLNQDLGSQLVKIDFGTNYNSANAKLNIGFAPQYPVSGSLTLAGEESRLLLFDPCGKIRKMYWYNKNHNLNVNSLMPDSIDYGNTTSRYCRCFEFTPYNPSNSNAKCASPNGGKGHFDSENLTNSFTLLGNVGSVTGTLKVTGNSVLTIQDAEMVFAPGAKIEVQPGSKIIIKNSYLHGCEGNQSWGGIEVKGNNNISGQIVIDGSQIWDAQVAVKAEKTNDVSISGTSFHAGTTAIEMDRVKGFQITKNEFLSYTYGIKTTKTIVSPADIRENYFFDLKSCIYSNLDNHTLLNVECNAFEKYDDYAIYSDNSTLKDQGSVTLGAGNTFVSNSTQINHEFRHKGNSMKYYYDPANPFSLVTSSGLTAIAQSASGDAYC